MRYLIILFILLFSFNAFADEEDLYVDAFDATDVEWTENGDSPYLQDTDADYIYATGTGQCESLWTFNDVSDASGQTINSVTLYVESKTDNTGDPAEIIDVTISGSSAGSVTPTSTDYAFYQLDVSGILDDEVAINAATMQLDSNRSGSGSFSDLYARRAYLKVDYTVAAAAPTGQILLFNQ